MFKSSASFASDPIFQERKNRFLKILKIKNKNYSQANFVLKTLKEVDAFQYGLFRELFLDIEPSSPLALRAINALKYIKCQKGDVVFFKGDMIPKVAFFLLSGKVVMCNGFNDIKKKPTLINVFTGERMKKLDTSTIIQEKSQDWLALRKRVKSTDRRKSSETKKISLFDKRRYSPQNSIKSRKSAIKSPKNLIDLKPIHEIDEKKSLLESVIIEDSGSVIDSKNLQSGGGLTQGQVKTASFKKQETSKTIDFLGKKKPQMGKMTSQMDKSLFSGEFITQSPNQKFKLRMSFYGGEGSQDSLQSLESESESKENRRANLRSPEVTAFLKKKKGSLPARSQITPFVDKLDVFRKKGRNNRLIPKGHQMLRKKEILIDPQQRIAPMAERFSVDYSPSLRFGAKSEIDKLISPEKRSPFETGKNAKIGKKAKNEARFKKGMFTREIIQKFYGLISIYLKPGSFFGFEILRKLTGFKNRMDKLNVRKKTAIVVKECEFIMIGEEDYLNFLKAHRERCLRVRREIVIRSFPGYQIGRKEGFKALLQSMRFESFLKGERILSEGKSARKLFVLLEGEISFCKILNTASLAWASQVMQKEGFEEDGDYSGIQERLNKLQFETSEICRKCLNTKLESANVVQEIQVSRLGEDSMLGEESLLPENFNKSIFSVVCRKDCKMIYITRKDLLMFLEGGYRSILIETFMGKVTSRFRAFNRKATLLLEQFNQKITRTDFSTVGSLITAVKPGERKNVIKGFLKSRKIDKTGPLALKSDPKKREEVKKRLLQSSRRRQVFHQQREELGRELVKMSKKEAKIDNASSESLFNSNLDLLSPVKYRHHSKPQLQLMNKEIRRANARKFKEAQKKRKRRRRMSLQQQMTASSGEGTSRVGVAGGTAEGVSGVSKVSSLAESSFSGIFVYPKQSEPGFSMTMHTRNSRRGSVSRKQASKTKIECEYINLGSMLRRTRRPEERLSKVTEPFRTTDSCYRESIPIEETSGMMGDSFSQNLDAALKKRGSQKQVGIKRNKIIHRRVASANPFGFGGSRSTKRRKISLMNNQGILIDMAEKASTKGKKTGRKRDYIAEAQLKKLKKRFKLDNTIVTRSKSREGRGLQIHQNSKFRTRRRASHATDLVNIKSMKGEMKRAKSKENTSKNNHQSLSVIFRTVDNMKTTKRESRRQSKVSKHNQTCGSSQRQAGSRNYRRARLSTQIHHGSQNKGVLKRRASRPTIVHL